MQPLRLVLVCYLGAAIGAANAIITASGPSPYKNVLWKMEQDGP